MQAWRKALGKMGYLLGRSPIGDCVIRVRRGALRGAKWTVLPQSSYWRGTSQNDIVEVMASLGDLTGKVCWDLGAHFGYCALQLARMTGPRGQVVAVEPDPFSARKLRRHVALNGADWVRVFEAAASDDAGEIFLLQKQGIGDSTSHIRYDDEEVDAGDPGCAVKRICLDRLVEEGVARLPDFIKIDVEGHGGRAIRGALRSVRDSLPSIVMSVHSLEELETTRMALEPLGYRAYSLSANPVEWPEIQGKTALLRAGGT